MTRRGIALLVVLAALALSTTSAMVLLRHATALSMASKDDLNARVADDLAKALTPSIMRWLRNDADDVVLPPHVSSPRQLVYEDSLDLGDRSCRMVVTAWDQYAMIPPDLLRRGSPIRSAVDTTVLGVVDATDAQSLGGLDVYAAAHAPTFPTDQAPTLGSTIATHNPVIESRRRRSAARLNVNTAPPEILEAAMQAAGYTNVSYILAARARGDRAAVSQAPDANPVDDHLAPVPTDRSDCWSIRLDVQVGSIRRSWWTVWERSRGQWRLVQRILIRE